jgi:hypothetical protein
MAAHDLPAEPDQAAAASTREAAPPGGEHDRGRGFVGYALAQQRRVDQLLGDRPRRLRLPGTGRAEAADAGGQAGRAVRDPEFRKNLRIFRRLLGEAVELHRRAVAGSGRSAASSPVLLREDALRERTAFPADLAWTLPLLLARRFELEQLLIEVGDREYLRGRLAELYDEGPGTHTTWRGLYGDALPALLPGQPGESGEDGEPGEDAAGIEVIRARLVRLMRVKEAEDQDHRARWELRRRAALLVLAVLAVVAAAFTLAVAGAVPDDSDLLAAAAAGAAGAALGGLVRLRDEVRLGAQVRQFSPFFLGEVVVGVTAGVVMFLVDHSGIVRVSGAGTGVAALAFVVGFSEAAFIGVLARVAGTVRQPGPAASAAPAAPGRSSSQLEQF